MSADASIYNMIRPPAPLPQQPSHFDQMGAMMQLRNLIDSGQMNDLQRQKLQGDMSEEAAFKSSLSNWVPGGQLPAEAVRASPTRANAFEKTRLEGEKTRGEIDKNKLEMLQKRATGMRDVIARVNSDADIPWAKDQIVRLEGPDQAANIFAKDPFFQGTFSPEKKAATLLTGDQLIANIEHHKNRTVTQAGQAETARHNLATEATAEAANKDKLQIVTDTEGNITVVDKNTGIGRPATDAEGNILKGRQNMTESQGKAAGMALRAREANGILGKLEAEGVTNRGVLKQAASEIPLIGGAAEMGVNVLPSIPFLPSGPSGKQQQVEQARRNFVNAVLRVESGASINESEFKNAEKQYFPMPGDTPEVKKQKAANRESAIAALELQSGPQKSKGNPMAPGGGSVMAPKGKSGIKFLGWE